MNSLLISDRKTPRTTINASIMSSGMATGISGHVALEESNAKLHEIVQQAANKREAIRIRT